MMMDMKDFFFDELELVFIFYVFLEEEVFLVDDYDVVENTKGRRKKVEVFCDILLRDGFELIMESFLYVVRKYKCIMKKIRRTRTEVG